MEGRDYPWLVNLSTQADLRGNSLIISGKLALGPLTARKMGLFSRCPVAFFRQTRRVQFRLQRSFGIVRLGGLVLQGVAGASYVIEATSDLAGDSWVPVKILTLESGQGSWVAAESSENALRFYRAASVAVDSKNLEEKVRSRREDLAAPIITLIGMPRYSMPWAWPMRIRVLQPRIMLMTR